MKLVLDYCSHDRDFTDVSIYDEGYNIIEETKLSKTEDKLEQISNILKSYNGEIESLDLESNEIKQIKNLDLTLVPNLKILDLQGNPIKDPENLNFELIPKLEELSLCRSFMKLNINLPNLKKLYIYEHIGKIEKLFILRLFTFAPLQLYTLSFFNDYEFLLMTNIHQIILATEDDENKVSPFILQKRETIRKRIWLIHNLFYFKRK